MKVDVLAERLDVPDDSRITPAEEYEESLGATSPSNWWMIGLVALGIVAAILLGLQLLNGAPGTDVQPGSPTAATEVVAE